MFVQIVQGKVRHPEQVRAELDRWAEELSRTSVGLLGATAGVTQDGQLINVARFESEEAARENNDQPKQKAWWAETAEFFEGTPTFVESSRVVEDVVGDPDQAGFVQVIQVRTTDSDRVEELMSRRPDDPSAARPDVLGSLSIGHDDGTWTTVIWFTSEAEARENEAKEMPEEMQQQMAEMAELTEGEPTFLDLTDPWLFTPRQ
ncbi:hypothetical protein ICW40_19940 [Actinotalea ferrariae]|uniref:hypothetical protein n=1 Tax=Actinotalea ferrariae TaxID=1386098 RepID=UPI001C8C2777|nr:hypothetical protein [Actinotalea ferrariae]MBX9247066.1 hypothetical protein [Actinotalea ferrariae]